MKTTSRLTAILSVTAFCLAPWALAEETIYFDDDFESYTTGFQPTEPGDNNPNFWEFGFGGASQNRWVEVVSTEDAEGDPTQALWLFQDTPLDDSRDGLSFIRDFGPVTDEEVEMTFLWRLNQNLYDPEVQELAGTYYQIRLRDEERNVAVRLQVTLDGEDGQRDRMTPDDPKPGFTLQQGPDRDTDRENLVPEILEGDWYEIVIRTYPPDQTFDIHITNLNSDDPEQSASATAVNYLDDATTSISEFSGSRSWTWSILDAHMDDVLIRTAPELEVPVGFKGWQEEHFTAEELDNEAISGPLATPVGDDVPNLLKYALGLDPWEPGIHRMPVPEVQPIEDEDFLTLSFVRPNAIEDIDYRVESAGDLTDSAEEAIRVSEEDLGDGTTEFTYRDIEPVGAKERGFLWLRVEQID